ncbi:hypothetical protein ACF0H5_004592 [Mactra antiquata]
MDAGYLCHTRGKTFVSEKSLKSHVKIHNLQSPYRCGGVNFHDKTHCQRHKCDKHEETKTNECPICSLKFGTSSELCTLHRRVHEKREFVCNDCSKELLVVRN